MHFDSIDSHGSSPRAFQQLGGLAGRGQLCSSIARPVSPYSHTDRTRNTHFLNFGTLSQAGIFNHSCMAYGGARSTWLGMRYVWGSSCHFKRFTLECPSASTPRSALDVYIGDDI